MEGPSSLSSWPPRHGTTAPRLPPPDRAARGARSPRTCQCRRTRPLPLLSHDAATAPPSRNERGPPVGLLLMVPPSPHTCKPPQPSTDQRSRVCVTVTARSRLFRRRYFRSHHPTPRLLIAYTYMYTTQPPSSISLGRSLSRRRTSLSSPPLSRRGDPFRPFLSSSLSSSDVTLLHPFVMLTLPFSFVD